MHEIFLVNYFGAGEITKLRKRNINILKLLFTHAQK